MNKSCFKEQEVTEATAKLLLKVARADETYAKMIDFSERTASFRIRVSDLPAFEPSIEKALRKLKIVPSTSFRGQKARVHIDLKTNSSLDSINCRLLKLPNAYSPWRPPVGSEH